MQFYKMKMNSREAFYQSSSFSYKKNVSTQFQVHEKKSRAHRRSHIALTMILEIPKFMKKQNI